MSGPQSGGWPAEKGLRPHARSLEASLEVLLQRRDTASSRYFSTQPQQGCWAGYRGRMRNIGQHEIERSPTLRQHRGLPGKQTMHTPCPRQVQNRPKQQHAISLSLLCMFASRQPDGPRVLALNGRAESARGTKEGHGFWHGPSACLVVCLFAPEAVPGTASVSNIRQATPGGRPRKGIVVLWPRRRSAATEYRYCTLMWPGILLLRLVSLGVSVPRANRCGPVRVTGGMCEVGRALQGA